MGMSVVERMPRLHDPTESASAIQNYGGPFVPAVVMGSVNDLVALFTAQTARQLSLDMSMGSAKPK